jgi:pimeloyl-ACP methyl ester carboxylesterase
MRKIRNGILAQNPAADVRVYSYKQFEDAQYVADLSQELSESVENIIGAAHSWGGWAWCRLAAYLPLGSVSDLFLADPVSRPPGGTLEIPGSVAGFHRWYKDGGLIPTANIHISDCEATSWLTDELVDVHHPRVDDDPEFIAAVVACAAK